MKDKYNANVSTQYLQLLLILRVIQLVCIHYKYQFRSLKGLEQLKLDIIDYFADQFPDKAKEKKTSLKKTVKTRKGGRNVK